MQVKIFQKFFPPFSSIRGTLIKGESLVSSIRSCRKSQFELHGARAGAPAFKPRPFPPSPPLSPPEKNRERTRRQNFSRAPREILLETRYNREYIRRTTAPTFTLRSCCASHAIRLSICPFSCFFFKPRCSFGNRRGIFFFFNYLIVTLICFFFFSTFVSIRE